MGYYDRGEKMLNWLGKELFAGGDKPPPDSTIVRDSLLTVSIHLYAIVSILVGIGIVVAIAAFIFNQKYAYRG